MTNGRRLSVAAWNLSAVSGLRFVIAYTIRATDEMFYPGGSLPVPAP